MPVIKEYTERAKYLKSTDIISISFKEMRGDDVVLIIDLCPNSKMVAVETPICSCGSKHEVKHREFYYFDTRLNPELCIDCWWEFLYEHTI